MKGKAVIVVVPRAEKDAVTEGRETKGGGRSANGVLAEKER